jgi:hypothetical protein
VNQMDVLADNKSIFLNYGTHEFINGSG